MKSQKLDFIRFSEAYNKNQIEKMKEKMRWVLTSCLDGRDSAETHDTVHNMYCIMCVCTTYLLFESLRHDSQIRLGF